MEKETPVTATTVRIYKEKTEKQITSVYFRFTYFYLYRATDSYNQLYAAADSYKQTS